MNLDIPVVFKEFIEALSSFKFLDVMTLIPFNVTSNLQSASADNVDNEGSAKLIYY